MLFQFMAQLREELLAVFTLVSLTHPLPGPLPLPQQMHVGKIGCQWNWDVAPIRIFPSMIRRSYSQRSKMLNIN